MNAPARNYQIYSVSVRWLENPIAGKDYSDWQKAEDGKINDYVGTKFMFKEETSLDQAKIYAKGWWNNYALKHVPYGEDKPLFYHKPHNVVIEIKFIERESWCLSWFSHFTYNVELSDEELLDSFQKFVWRHISEQQILDLGPKHSAYQQAMENGAYLHCLMGAADRWRWEGPCRCENCIKLGITRIDH